MIKNIFIGEKVRLLAMNPEIDGKLMSEWRRDTEYARLLDSDPVRLWSGNQMKDWFENKQKNEAFEEINFMIYPLESEEPIGFIELDGIAWHHRTSWVGIGIGNRDYWGQGYGSDAMRILSRYAFDELGLYRLNLNVFSNNTRAIQAYENVGFKVEGAIRDALHRDNQRWDLVFMGLLEEDFRHQT
ncbi:MAG: GNAT family N-acetyltransferase [Anaerolineales bacterium]|uniref:GNAT family N-acetyltransferase n=1 Tax=Candidatus Desulfolinea nitratireducens TaxID=2841698 RepID=A0A8J6NM11_9CHLR|nr:GNAT family N-acetyltransferase [Candidatus Desulfolinea nitratireducens]MBL6961065.1 GNAT family N-acetyltransferase [Anaerolineales bacterium]